jgi:cob(I)alamin adenosyltransferase
MVTIYTKTGDDGSTALFGGARVPKSHPRLEVYGTVDELNSAIGFARSLKILRDVDRELDGIQHDLFRLGAEIAAVNTELLSPGTRIGQKDIAHLEETIDRFDRRLPPLRNFILPGGHPGAAAVHCARTICRRAERQLIRLMAEEQISRLTVIYLNRLSDLLFVFARVINRRKKIREAVWTVQRPGTTGKKK